MANRYWIGGCPGTKKRYLVDLGGAWVAGETILFTVGNKSLILTIGAGVTLTIVAEESIAAINAAKADDPAPATDYERNFGGREIPEFLDFIAEAHESDVDKFYVTAVDPGVDFTFSSTETSAAGTVAVTVDTEGTGPNHANEARNYLAGVLPINGDTIYFVQGAHSVLYALDYFRGAGVGHNVFMTNDWTGQMGLPPTNATRGYREYRERFYQMHGTGGEYFKLRPGSLGSQNQGQLYVDCTGPQFEIDLKAQRGLNTASPQIFLRGGHATLGHYLSVDGPGVEIEAPDNPAATPFKLRFCYVGHPGAAQVSGGGGGTLLIMRSGAVWDADLILSQYSGRFRCERGTGEAVTGETNIFGGTFEPSAVSGSLDWLGLTAHRGAVVKPSGPPSAAQSMLLGDWEFLTGSTLDAREAQQVFSVGGSFVSFKASAESTLLDPAGRLIWAAAGNDLDTVFCSLKDINHDLAMNRRLDGSTAL